MAAPLFSLNPFCECSPSPIFSHRGFAIALLLALLGLASVAHAYVLTSPAPAARRAPSARMLSPADFDFAATASLIAEIVDQEGERIYGAVEAPGWVLPVGGGLAVLTALLPVLLAPGDEALQRQRDDESKMSGDARGDIFGRGRRD